MTKEKRETPSSEPISDLNIYQRLHRVMEAVGHVPKTGRNTSQGYNFVTEADVMNKVREACLLHGVVILTSVIDSNQRELVTGKGAPYTLTTVITRMKAVNIDCPSEFVEWDMIGQGSDSQDKGSNKAVTGSVKYGLLKPLLIGTNDDAEDDRNGVDDRAPVKPMQQQKTTYAAATARQEKGLPAQEGVSFNKREGFGSFGDDSPPPISDADVASIAFSLDDDTPDFMKPSAPARKPYEPARPGEVFKYAGKGIYDRKEEIKAGGAKWDKDKKVWESDHPIPGFEQYLVGATQNG